MKNRIATVLCLCIFFLGASCKKEADELTMESKLASKCTFDERKTVGKFNNEQGTVTYLQDYDVYMIIGGNPSDNMPAGTLEPCNLPEGFKKDRLKVIFSGELKQTYSTEYRLGWPLKLTEIKLAEN
ncbi:hypothetical protein I0P70_14390 [Pontibacter sp. FD36]|uniref:hypothetical protein n=1 Tax=Pontibacter sp. FD36 TaxID=2789860 RepID=UPI0018AAB534|nr:hypothetical protein [Pontibacter sp. FD36]MBF8964439.1 hypothetical protein [Pontibacter sp. FD36]